jgi:hypothetical protein
VGGTQPLDKFVGSDGKPLSERARRQHVASAECNRGVLSAATHFDVVARERAVTLHPST